MSGEALGGGVMVAFAAALWVVYLMPTWSRRRHYLATERNAVRLQQTLRVLAETAEVPEEVHLEANARTVATQRKLLAKAEQDALAEARAAEEAAREARRAAMAARAAAAARLAAELRQTAASLPVAAKLSRLRRLRALSTLLLLTGMVLAVAGIAQIVIAGSWLAFGLGVVAIAASLGALSKLARAARAARVVEVAPVAIAPATAPRFEPVQLEESPVVRQPWTPQPLPRPLHLSKGSIAQAAMASVDAAAELRKAAVEAELARRAAEIAAQQAPVVTPIARPAAASAAASTATAAATATATATATASATAAAAAAPSRFASMGIVGDTTPGMADLDAVLRRRRAVG